MVGSFCYIIRNTERGLRTIWRTTNTRVGYAVYCDLRVVFAVDMEVTMSLEPRKGRPSVMTKRRGGSKVVFGTRRVDYSTDTPCL